MKTTKWLLTLVLLCSLLPVCQAEGTDRAEQVLSQLTLRQKVGQLFFIRPDSLDEALSIEEVINPKAEGTAELSESMKDFYQRYPAGGIVLFKKNLRDDAQLRKLTGDTHALGEIAAIVAVDEEGGMVSRLANSGLFDVPKYPRMQEIAETGDPSQAYSVGNGIGAYLSDYGFDATFAPVADVNSNPDNPVIGKRAFGDDPEMAAQMVAAYLDGLHETGTMGCVKHFPGHGDTNTDTHLGYAETEKTWEEMLNCEMIPFRSGIESGTDMVMVAHIAAPSLTGSSIPASLSFVTVTEKLRGELGYDSVVITDGMEMGAITEDYAAGDAALQAILAGVDIVLLPEDYPAAFEGVMEAVRAGIITEERLDESVLRILRLKAQYGLL